MVVLRAMMIMGLNVQSYVGLGRFPDIGNQLGRVFGLEGGILWGVLEVDVRVCGAE
jgi:hypothetical protein